MLGSEKLTSGSQSGCSTSSAAISIRVSIDISFVFYVVKIEFYIYYQSTFLSC